MGLTFALAVVLCFCIIALGFIFALVFGVENAPTWVDEDDYYRHRWYK